MQRQQIVSVIGTQYLTANIESDEWSYAKEAGGIGKLAEALGHKPLHYKLDRRFYDEDESGRYAVLVETKQNFSDSDEKQLAEYLEEEYALHRGVKVIAILANTNDDCIRVWKSEIDDNHIVVEHKLEKMDHYKKLFAFDYQNDREAVMRNTYALNEKLHKKDIDEAKRSQFVGTCLLYLKHELEKYGNGGRINEDMRQRMALRWRQFSEQQIRSGIGEVLEDLLDDSSNKSKKVQLLKRDVLEDQKVKSLTVEEWVDILSDIMMNVYRYIDVDSSEGQDILNLFFITFNKYVGKADKNQAFTPDHITDFMARITEIDMNDRVLDICCGSGSFLVQAMVKELADCKRKCGDVEYTEESKNIKQEHIFGIEVEEKAYGLATTNMLIHGDGNSNVEFGSCFAKRGFICEAKPSVILMNPPYNSKPRSIPNSYKRDWTIKERDGKSDPTKGLVFVKYLSDIAKAEQWQGTKLAVLLPMAAAIGTGARISEMKKALLKDNTLDAVFSLPSDVFYPGAAVEVCCMLFTLNQSHYELDGKTPRRQTFFGYYRNDGFRKRKNVGRVELADTKGGSVWKRQIEPKWISLFRNKTVEAGMSAMKAVTGEDEWLCEAYMETDYTTLTESDFQQSINDYLAYLVKTGKVFEA